MVSCPPNLSSTWSAVCLQMRGTARPNRGIDQKWIRSGEYHNGPFWCLFTSLSIVNVMYGIIVTLTSFVTTPSITIVWWSFVMLKRPCSKIWSSHPSPTTMHLMARMVVCKLVMGPGSVEISDYQRLCSYANPGSKPTSKYTQFCVSADQPLESMPMPTPLTWQFFSITSLYPDPTAQHSCHPRQTLANSHALQLLLSWASCAHKSMTFFPFQWKWLLTTTMLMTLLVP